MNDLFAKVILKWDITPVICFQNASFLVFLIILAIILIRIRKAPARSRTNLSEKRSASDVSSPTGMESGLVHGGVHGGHTYTKTFLWVLVISSLLIFARTLYRLAETAEGEFP
jgi:hypothetical protein